MIGAGFGIYPQFAHGQAAAQDAAQQAAAPDQLQEVVVTAEKVQGTEQHTPISMTVYDAQSLLQHDITSVGALVTIDPSLNKAGTGGYLSLRGVTSTDTTEIGSPSVPVVIDDYSTNRAYGLNVSMFDIQRVEVLRGPQGTLYGRSATGGVINVVTNKPSKQFEAEGSIEFGDYNLFKTDGVINVPVSDWLQLRGAFQLQRHDGYRGIPVGVSGLFNSGIDPSISNERGNDEDDHSGRVEAAFGGGWFHGLLSFEEIWIGGIGPNGESIPMSGYLLPNGDVTHQQPTLVNAVSFPIYGLPWQRINDKVARWNLQASLPAGMTLSFLGGYGLLEYHVLGSGGNGQPQLINPTSPYFPYQPFRQYQQNQEPHTTNMELRLTSGTSSPLTWQTGLYFFQEFNTLWSHGVYAPGGNGTGLPPGAPGLNGILPGGDYIEFSFPEVRQASHAVYGQGSYAFNDQNKLTLGLRYNQDYLQRTGIANILTAGPPGGLRNVSQFGTAYSNRMTWHAGYDLQYTPQNLLYAKLDNGYKPGGFDTCGTYGPESVITAEFGSKNRLRNQTMQLNGDVYYDDYTDQQVAEFTASCVTATHTTNAGKSEIYGAEAELIALVTPNDQIDINGSYLHARYKAFLNPPTIGRPGLGDAYCSRYDTHGQCDLTGNTLPYSPNWSFTASYEHNWTVRADGRLNLRLEGKYSATQYFSPFDYPDSAQPAYGTMNAYLTYLQNNWQIGIWGRNLTNTTYLISGGEGTGGGNAVFTYAFGDPRTVGIRLQANIH